MENETLIETLLIIQRRMGEEWPEVRQQLAEILHQAYEKKGIPPASFVLLSCILLGQEGGLTFARRVMPWHVYREIFPDGHSTMLQ